MSLFDPFGYRGKRALVVGGATGMGAAAAEVVRDAGAEVIVMDRSKVTLSGVKTISVDLAEKGSIDVALKECGGKVDALFSCAGVADGTPGIERINFIGHRYLIDRFLETGALRRGSTIGMISSAAGLGWESNLEILNEYLDTHDFDAATKWAVDSGRADYWWSKQAMCAYIAREAMGFLKQGIRLNGICPGPTDTPLAQANKEMWLGFGADYRADVGIEASTPQEQAYPLVFLCSDAAAAIAGQTIITDGGYFPAGITGVFPDATPMVNMLLGR